MIDVHSVTMSDDERSDSASMSEGGEDVDVQTTGLIATRAKRSNAGNLYASLRANLDDEELQKELLAEDEDDVGDYEGSEKSDDDDALESSSDEEDAGPPREGDEDLEGEKLLKKEERAEIRKKRKAQDARLKLPSSLKNNKRVKLADDRKTEGSAPIKPKKKSERSNWLPTEADAPVRQSRRSLAVANREVTHANLQESYERSEKQRRVMKNAAEREKTTQRRVMSQQERLELCEKIAKQTDKEFGRWERDEAERQRLRDEALAAKRNRGFDGPFVRHWSGSVLWEGERIKIKRMSSKRVEEIKGEPKEAASDPVEGGNAPVIHQPATPNEQATGPLSNDPQQTLPQHASAPPGPEPWLQGIHDYASQPTSGLPTTNQQQLPTPQIEPIVTAPASNAPATAYPPPASAQHSSYIHPASSTYGAWAPGPHLPPHVPVSPPAAPLIREQAQRSLVILEQFDQFENAPRRSRTASVLEPTVTASVILPEAFPPFTSDESRYLTAKHKRNNLPPEPEKAHCAIICSEKARFRDPKTGLAYRDMHTYKIIQRVLAGGCQWSSLLGAWVGPSYGVMGRPAAGVPVGFAGGARPGLMVSGASGASVVKVEGGQ